MKNLKRLWRTLLFSIVLAALCGSFGFPVVDVPVKAAPLLQATSCTGTTIAKWDFTGSVLTPSIGLGALGSGTGVNGPVFQNGQTTAENPAISLSGFGN